MHLAIALAATSRVIETTERRSAKSTFINLHGQRAEALPTLLSLSLSLDPVLTEHSVEWAATRVAFEIKTLRSSSKLDVKFSTAVYTAISNQFAELPGEFTRTRRIS